MAAALAVLAPGLLRAQSQGAKSQATAGSDKLGATVYSQDGQLAGAVDEVAGDQIVIGLAGYLGQGAKDVAIPAAGLSFTVEHKKLGTFSDGQYGGGSDWRVTVPLSLSELVGKPEYNGPSKAGVPSPNTSTPQSGKTHAPPSSTQSGGPG